MDGLSTLASLIAVAQISGSIVSLCYEYRNGLQTASHDMDRLVKEVKSLRDVLETLIELVGQDHPTDKLFESLEKFTQRNGIVDDCKSMLQDLEARLRLKDGWRKLGQRLIWPFKEQDVMKSVASIERFKATLSLAMSIDHSALSITILGTAKGIQTSTDNLTQQFQSLKMQENIRAIESWLAAPNSSVDFRAALEKRQTGTGLWLTQSRKYTEWKQNPGKLLWAHGIPGCGKSVLSACVIDDLLASCGREANTTLAYFYFDLNDQSKRSGDDMLRSLVLQTSRQFQVAFKSLQKLYKESTDYWRIERELGARRPFTELLLQTLQTIINQLDHTYLVLDGLDESSDLEAILAHISRITSHTPLKVSVFVTSRDETDIQSSLEKLSAWQIPINGAEVDNDIRIFIEQSLREDSSLSKWSESLRGEIQKTLVDGAQGMFRWVECQLAVIRKCVKPQAIKRALSSLPKSLEGSYLAILGSIDEVYAEDTHTILQWMVCCRRPLLLTEVVEILAFDLDERLSFHPDFRVPDPKDILKVCSNLIAISPPDSITGIREVRLAHSTVRDFLVNRTTSPNGTGSFLIVEDLAHKTIAQMCLVYLLYIGGHAASDTDYDAKFPLALYAAQNWIDHYKAARYPDEISSLATTLFTSPDDALKTWIRTFNIDKPWGGSNRQTKNPAGPLYYASRAPIELGILPCSSNYSSKRLRIGSSPTLFAEVANSSARFNECSTIFPM